MISDQPQSPIRWQPIVIQTNGAFDWNRKCTSIRNGQLSPSHLDSKRTNGYHVNNPSASKAGLSEAGVTLVFHYELRCVDLTLRWGHIISLELQTHTPLK